MERVELKIEGMSCGHCVRAVREALAEVPGVVVLEVEVGRAVVERPETVRADALSTALAEAGYRVVAG
jgi:copper chaperone CopZ